LEKKFLRYRLDKKIGEGYFSETFKAFDETIEREVLLKLLKHPSQISGKNIKVDEKKLNEFFLKESRLLQKASVSFLNKHVPFIFDADFSEKDKRLYLVQEFVKGATLWDIVKASERQLDVKNVANYALQLFEGLKDIHDAGIIHRDLKHDALMLDNQGILKIIDFGLAEQINYPEAIENLKSSAYFIAPERLNEGITTKLSDVWSAGVVLYRLLSDNLPFNSIEEVLKKDPIPLHELRPEIPDFLDFAVMNALIKDLDKRNSSRRIYEILRAENPQSASRGVFDLYIDNLRTSFIQKLISHSLIIPDVEKLNIEFKNYANESRWWTHLDFKKANLNSQNIVFGGNRDELLSLYLKCVSSLNEKSKIPVYIDLSESYDPDIEMEIIRSLNAVAKVEIEPGIIRDRLNKGEFFLMFDGISESRHPEKTAEDLSKFLSSKKDRNLEVIVGCLDKQPSELHLTIKSELDLVPVPTNPSALIDKLIAPNLRERLYIALNDPNIDAMIGDFDTLRHTIDYFNRNKGDIELAPLYEEIASKLLSAESRKTGLPASLIKTVLKETAFELFSRRAFYDIKLADLEEVMIDSISIATEKGKYDPATLEIRDKIMSSSFINFYRRNGYYFSMMNYFCALSANEKIFSDLPPNEKLKWFVDRNILDTQRVEAYKSNRFNTNTRNLTHADESTHPFNFIASMSERSFNITNTVAKINFPLFARMAAYGKDTPEDIMDELIGLQYVDLKRDIRGAEYLYEFFDIRKIEIFGLECKEACFLHGKSFESALIRMLNEKKMSLLSNIPTMGHESYSFQKFLIDNEQGFSPLERKWALINMNCAFRECHEKMLEYYNDIKKEFSSDPAHPEDIITYKRLTMFKMFEGVNELRDRYHCDAPERRKAIEELLDKDEHKAQICEFLDEMELKVK
jgi:serine/threonine protein kinase